MRTCFSFTEHYVFAFSAHGMNKKKMEMHYECQSNEISSLAGCKQFASMIDCANVLQHAEDDGSLGICYDFWIKVMRSSFR